MIATYSGVKLLYIWLFSWSKPCSSFSCIDSPGSDYAGSYFTGDSSSAISGI